MSLGRRLPHALLPLLLAAAVLCPATAALAGAPVPQPLGGATKQPDYKLTVAPGLANKARLGWMPVYVAVEAGRDFDGDLVVQFRSQGGAAGVLYEARKGLKLAAGSKTEHHLCLRHDSPSVMQGVVEARLEDVRDTAQTQGVVLVPQSEYLVCVVSDRPLSLGFLSVRRTASAAVSGGQPAKVRQFTVAQPALAELPDKVAGYNSVDFLLIYQASFEKLRREQLAAIGDYLWQGGCVVLCARDRAWFSRSEVQDLVTIRDPGAAAGGDGDLLLRMLASNHGAFTGETAGSTVHRFNIPGARDERSFYEVHRGLGTALVWRLDPGQNVIGAWQGMPGLWTDVAAAVLPLRAASDPQNYSWRAESPSLTHAREVAIKLNLARERSVPGLLIVFLVVLYLVLVGPINYFALRKLDMRALSIVTLPLLAAVFVLLNFVVGYVSRGALSQGRRVTVAVAPSGVARADCLTWLGLFPASSSLAELDTDGRGLILPLSETSLAEHSGYQAETYTSERTVRREERFMLERYALAMWKMFHFQAESTRPLGGTLKLVERGGKKFTATNSSPLALKDCFVAAGAGGGEFCWLGDLAAGASSDGTLVPWTQAPRDFSQQGRQPKPLALSGAVQLWTNSRLGSGQSYVLDNQQEGFAYQAAQVISSRLESLPHRGLVLVGRVDGEELDALRLNGRTPRGEGINVLVVTGEREGGAGR
jgi:hypothetical protein